ncbi:MAG: hypothetical protein LBG46_05670 [Elusimicrobiota bacterium]|jgi:hypothetical protein|nr:hypothetical protein [Elusimicrobiota bacterium]
MRIIKTNFYTLIFKAVSNKKAQIILPAVMIVPIILLSVYLLFETTKLSRAKIRSQFALDSAAAAELTAASNYLNATAYVNGAFPYRIFKEYFTDEKHMIAPDMSYAGGGGTPAPKSVFEFFYKAGAIPAPPGGENARDPAPDAAEWVFKHERDTDEIEGQSAQADWDNSEEPKATGTYNLTLREMVKSHYPYIITEDVAIGEYNKDHGVKEEDVQGLSWLRLYMTIYIILEDIYNKQKKVYESIVNTSELFRKAYYLNAGDAVCKKAECGREGAKVLQSFVMATEGLYIKEIFFNFRDARGHGNIMTEDPTKLSDLGVDRLFQLAFLSSNSRSKIRELYRGVSIKQTFPAPSNYFNVNLNAGRVKPYNHVRAALQCAKGESNNCIWPNPTSKYQVRLFP